MSVCLRKLPKIGLSVVSAFASIPPLRSGTAAPPLLSLPYVRFICFADSAHYRVFAMKKLAVQPHTTQSYISDFLIISKILAFIRNVRILCNEKHGFYLCFSSKFCNSNLYISSRKCIFCNVITKANGLFLWLCGENLDFFYMLNNFFAY